MKIGIDISQLAYGKTGVPNYLEGLVRGLLATDKENEYILFFSSLRGNLKPQISSLKNTSKNVKIKSFRFPPTLLDLLWNKLHVMPIEDLIGDVDVFISSDWTEPPTKKARKITILYDLIVYKYPEETHNKTEFSFKNLLLSPNIVASQKRKLEWTKKECDMILCISESTKSDAKETLGIDESRLRVAYPGLQIL
jgi:hypothetical protein